MLQKYTTHLYGRIRGVSLPRKAEAVYPCIRRIPTFEVVFGCKKCVLITAHTYLSVCGRQLRMSTLILEAGRGSQTDLVVLGKFLM